MVASVRYLTDIAPDYDDGDDGDDDESFVGKVSEVLALQDLIFLHSCL
jgi:hypothetical protein